MTKLAIVTTEILPPFSVSCAGGGVRAWGIGELLRHAGIDCTYFLPESKVAGLDIPTHVPLQTYKPELLHQRLAAFGCDAVLFEQWQPLSFLQEPLDIPILVDLPGPLVMEYYWRDNDNYFQHIVDKVECLAKADYYICALDRQQGYYQAWLTWAGMTPDENRITTVPFCFPEMPFSRQGHVEDEPLFFWGGLFWPWQERMTAFRWIAETLRQVRQGQLVVLGGGDREEDVRGEFRQFLNHPHISWLGNFCFAEYICELKRSSVAVDLCQTTAERTLSSDLRTGVSLWAGTPCLVTESSPWASLIEEHNAGWVVPYADEKKIKSLIKEIALDRGDLVAKRRGARDISTKISQPLSNPVFLSWFTDLSKRPKSPTFLTARGHDREQRLKSMQQELDQTRFELDTVKHDLHAIRSKKIFQLYKKMQGLLGK